MLSAYVPTAHIPDERAFRANCGQPLLSEAAKWACHQSPAGTRAEVALHDLEDGLVMVWNGK